MSLTYFCTASRIHDGQRFLPEGSVLEVSRDGVIIGVHGAEALPGAAHYEGTLCPAFVNAHCHLELSHMRGAIPEGTGLIPFLQRVTRGRAGFSDEQKLAARHAAYDELRRNGVVAVGDIANSTDTLDLRTRSDLHVHTFVECMGFTDTGGAARLAHAHEVLRFFQAQDTAEVMLRQTIVPHAPYSVSPALFRLIDTAQGEAALLSIHNGESPAEDEYYRTKTGPVCDLLSGFGIDDSFFPASGISALQTYLPLISEAHPIILVHNTCTRAEDVLFAQRRAGSVFWSLCPGANWYIERRLPDLEMLCKTARHICIGTDSLASNHQLSVLGELQFLKESFPFLEWEELLRWGTYNGACALQMQNTVGSFTKGLKPGILHLRALGEHNIQRIC